MSKGFRSQRDRLAKAEFPANARFVDATPAFNATAGACFIDEVHHTEEGNRALIACIARAIAAGGHK